MELERDPTFRMYDMYDVTKDQIRERTMEKVCVMSAEITIRSRLTLCLPYFQLSANVIFLLGPSPDP